MHYYIIPVTVLSQNCSIIWSDHNHMNQAALVDPGGDFKIIVDFLNKNYLIPSKILITHGHLDHVGAAYKLAEYYKIPIIGPHIRDLFWLNNIPMQSKMFRLHACDVFIPDTWLKEGDTVVVGNRTLKVLFCPGHTPGHVVFFDVVGRLLISGDVIFNRSIGRTDLVHGNHQQLIASIKDKLLPLGDDVTFLPGHGPTSTLGYERIYNCFLN